MKQCVSFVVCLSFSVFTLVPASAADLCRGLVTDRQPHPTTALAKPAVGVAVKDPQFGGTIRRITAVTPLAGSAAAIVPVYSTVSAWNADESLLLLYHVGRGHELYDGRTYRFLRSLPFAPNDIEQVYWHTTDRDVLYYLNGNRLMRYRVSTATSEVVHAFTACTGSVSGGDDPMFTSWDSNTIGLKCGSLIFGYQIATNTTTASATTSLDPPKVAPSGTIAMIDRYVLGLDLGVRRALDIANPYDHASLGRTADGRDVYNTVAFDRGPAGSGIGSLVSFDLQSGAAKVVVGPNTGWPYPPSGTHISSLAYRAPGWVYASIVGNPSGAGVLDNELVLANVSTGAVCRAAHHRSFGQNNVAIGNAYWAEPHVVTSPSGTRAIFGSDWGGGGSVDTYVLELPADAGVTTAIVTNKRSYVRGDVMSEASAFMNAGKGGTADLYVLEVQPDGDQVVMLTPQGRQNGRLSQLAGLVPYLSGVDLSKTFDDQRTLPTYTWTGTETAGVYSWIVAAVRPGAFADGRADEGDVIASSTWPLMFSR